MAASTIALSILALIAWGIYSVRKDSKQNKKYMMISIGVVLLFIIICVYGLNMMISAMN